MLKNDIVEDNKRLTERRNGIKPPSLKVTPYQCFYCNESYKVTKCDMCNKLICSDCDCCEIPNKCFLLICFSKTCK